MNQLIRDMAVEFAREKQNRGGGRRWDRLDYSSKELRVRNIVYNAMLKRILGTIDCKTPEQMLFWAVIEQAIRDGEGVMADSNQEDGKQFFETQSYRWYCHMLGLDHKFVRQTISEFLEW